MATAEMILEFNQIKKTLAELAHSQRGKENLMQLSPSLNEAECRRKMDETTAARKILECCGTPPLPSMKETEKYLALAQAGSMLSPEQLNSLALFALSCGRMKAYLKKAEAVDETIGSYGGSLDDMAGLREEIETCIRNEQVDSAASPALRDIRRKLENTSSQIHAKLASILSSNRKWFSENSAVQRNGCFVLPVKKEYKNQFAGHVRDISGSGSTYFMEPVSVARLQSEISALQIEEENEVRRILYTLTVLVDERRTQFLLNIEAMETLDVLFAKGRLSLQMNASPVEVAADREIRIYQGRHPLLDQKACVPLDFFIGGEVRGVVITGPNTGGKTVALKTVGLLSMMAQSGLHVPASPDSHFSMHNAYLCDIGDGQSITENLSTFSAHITNIIGILDRAGKESLILLDELGSGTDPAEGMGIAVSILEELRKRECLFIATTHYPEVKDYAARTDGLINARMAFDRESLKPLYRLEIGEAGESCALFIAQRLGFPAHMLEIARCAAYGQGERIGYSLPELPENTAPTKITHSPGPALVKAAAPSAPRKWDSFQIGDSVTVYPSRETGIVYQTANQRGEIGVQVKGKKMLIPYKRIQLQVPASELYPPDYDFSILFDSVENRKARKQMGKRHRPDLVVSCDPEIES